MAIQSTFNTVTGFSFGRAQEALEDAASDLCLRAAVNYSLSSLEGPDGTDVSGLAKLYVEYRRQKDEYERIISPTDDFKSAKTTTESLVAHLRNPKVIWEKASNFFAYSAESIAVGAGLGGIAVLGAAGSSTVVGAPVFTPLTLGSMAAYAGYEGYNALGRGFISELDQYLEKVNVNTKDPHSIEFAIQAALNNDDIRRSLYDSAKKCGLVTTSAVGLAGPAGAVVGAKVGNVAAPHLAKYFQATAANFGDEAASTAFSVTVAAGVKPAADAGANTIVANTVPEVGKVNFASLLGITQAAAGVDDKNTIEPTKVALLSPLL